MQNLIYALDDFEFIRISGPDSISFLQGQVSCNTELLSAERSLTGALCNLKGRVIADFRLLQRSEDIIMQCAAGMANTILSTLSKYAVFSKVELSLVESNSDSAPRVLGILDESVEPAMALLGLNLPEKEGDVNSTADCSVIRISQTTKRVEIWIHTRSAADQLSAQLEVQASPGREAWLRADIEAGIIHVDPAMSEEFTPQLLNYDLSGLIDFKKGCYTGQEVVARMFYRGTAKRRLQLAKSSHQISAASRIVTSENDAIEEDILAFSNADSAESVLLAVLPMKVVDSRERMTLSDNAAAQVSILELPYSMDS